MKKTHHSFLSTACLLFLCFLCDGCLSRYTPQQDQVCFKDQCITVEVVQKEEDRLRGLQFRQSLAPHGGMLFIFPETQRQSFWMKDTLISLDIIWIDSTQRVVHIEHNVPPCPQDPCPIYAPAGLALYVLEINAGQAAQLKLQLGDRAEFKIN